MPADKQGSTLISRETLLPLGLVFSLLIGAAFMGQTYQRVIDIEKRLSRIETKLDGALSNRTSLMSRQ